MYVVSVAEMRAAEAAANASGVSAAALQARAGAVVAATARRLQPRGPVVVLAGIGNNGRDGWVAALALARAGRVVRLYLAPRHAITSDELEALAVAGGVARLHSGSDTLALLGMWLADATLAVDGLLGIGARGAPRPPIGEIAATLNRARAERGGGLSVLAIDVPSGVDADSGAVEGECVQADATLVLGALKQGLLRFPAAGLAGELAPGDIGLPPGALSGQPVQTLGRSTVLPDVPRRPLDGHKGIFGRVVVAGGSPDYYGAPYLAGVAALRAGCGLLAFAAAPALQAVLAGLLPEATYLVLPEGAPQEGAGEAAETVAAALTDAQALVLGPGIGRSDGARAFVQGVVEARGKAAAEVPAVVDADALFVLAAEPALLASLGPEAVLTPHHGEMGRLTGQTAPQVAAAPWETARAAAARWGVVVVLKGPFTVVAAPSREAWVWPHANPALATGGTGDVLAGTIGGLLAQGVPTVAAARLGVYVHATAARACLAASGADLLLASDLPREIARQLSGLRRERGDPGVPHHPAWQGLD